MSMKEGSHASSHGQVVQPTSFSLLPLFLVLLCGSAGLLSELHLGAQLRPTPLRPVRAEEGCKGLWYRGCSDDRWNRLHSYTNTSCGSSARKALSGLHGSGAVGTGHATYRLYLFQV